MKNKILQMLFLAVFVLNYQIAYSQPEIGIEEPPSETSPEIGGISFSDGWWDISLSPNSTLNTDMNGFTTYSNARFVLNNRVITDMNPNSLYCPVVQIATVLKYHSRHLVAQTRNEWDWGGQPMYSTSVNYELDPDTYTEPFDLVSQVEYGCSYPPSPSYPPQTIQPEVISVGGIGASMLRYDWESTIGLNATRYRHMPHEGRCPAYCGEVPPKQIDFYSDQTPSPRMRVITPWGPFGCYTWGGIATGNASGAACFDVGWN